MYTFLRKLSTRTVIRGEGDLEAAKKYVQAPFCCVEDEDGNIYNNVEELEHVEIIRSEPRIGYDKFFTGGSEISEDTDRELSEPDSDNTEQSTECDN